MNEAASGGRSVTFALPGKTALVTGGRSGIGWATVQLLAQSGVQVLALDISDPQVKSEQDGVLHMQADVVDEDAVRAAVAPHIGPTGLSYLVNCAGIHQQVSLADISADQWRRMLDVNLVAPAMVTRAVLPWLREAPSPAVVNVASLESTAIVALVNPEPVPHYAASKAAVQMLTRTMARDYSRFGIRVNSVAPGFVATPMSRANHARNDGHDRSDGPNNAADDSGVAVLPAAAAARVPMGRYAQPGEVASAIVFLLSEGAAYMTGTSMLIDGGFCTT